MRKLLPGFFLFLIRLLSSGSLNAQTNSPDLNQVWPQLDAYYRLNEKFRFYGSFSSTRSNSAYTDGSAGIYVDYFALPWLRDRRNETEMRDSARGYYLWFRMGYSYSDAPSNEPKKQINIYETEANNYFRIPERLVMILRNRIDWRWVDGNFQPIYRPRLKIVRNFKTEYLAFNAYAWSEYYFYLNDPSQNRLRLSFGVEIKVLKWLDFETYYLYQYKNMPAVQPVNAFGLQFNLYFSSKAYKNRK